MLLFYLLSLLISTITFNYYVSSKVETSIHRLLPLSVILIGLFELCQVGCLLSGGKEIFVILEDLLVLEMLYILTNYIQEFNYIHMRKPVEAILHTANVAMGVIAILQYAFPGVLWLFKGYVQAYLAGLLIVAISLYKKSYFSAKERFVVKMLFVILASAVVGLMFRNVEWVDGDVLVTVIFDVICVITLYLMLKDQLIDHTSLMHQDLFSTAEFALALFDTDYYLLEANEVAKSLFPAKLKKTRRDMQDEAFRMDVKRFVEFGEVGAEFEKDGKYYQGNMKPFEYQGELRGYIMTVMDVTEQKAKLQRIEQLKKEAESQSLSKSKFLASMSHDLRSPLHAVIGASDVLMTKDNLTAMHRGYIQMIRNSSKVLLGLVNDILLHSKLEAGKLVLAKNPYSIEQMLRDLAQMMIMNLASKPVTFSLNFETAYPAEVIGDQMRVREVIQNIISNSVKFTEEGSITCNISCEEDAANNRVKFSCSVTDTGPGMSKEQISMMFDEYASFANQRKKDGTGLGMTIVRQLTSLMEGTARAESDGATGSTIYVRFYQELGKTEWRKPIQLTEKELMKRSIRLEQIDLPKVRFMDAKVLVVDDIEVNQKVFKQVVQRWGIDADTASSGMEAIEMAKNKEYHLIFLDYMMPKMDGMETATKIWEFSKVPIVLLTADASDETKKRCMEAGFADYMGKPIDTKQLERNLERHIPSAYRIAVTSSSGLESDMTDEAYMQREIEAKRTILKTVVSELEQIYEKLQEYFESDLDMYRIKVHGIKGLTRQIGKRSMSRQAEIMEMAAKTGNRRFIEENMDDFLFEVKDTLEEVRTELALLPEKKVERTEEKIDTLLERLWEAFDAFDLKSAEACVEQLKLRELSGSEQELVEKLAAACDEIDYEEGCRLLEEYKKQK